MAKKTKPISQGVQPPGTIPQVITVKYVDYRCICVDIAKDEFTFKGSNGKEFIKKWCDIPLK